MILTAVRRAVPKFTAASSSSSSTGCRRRPCPATTFPPATPPMGDIVDRSSCIRLVTGGGNRRFQIVNRHTLRYYVSTHNLSSNEDGINSKNDVDHDEDNEDGYGEDNTPRDQPLPTMDGDYFALFGLPRKFGLSLPVLKRRYLRLMTEHHPDKQNHHHHHGPPVSPSDDDHSQTITANYITNAYQTLLKPHTRATHLLELYDHPLLEGDGVGGGSNTTDDDADPSSTMNPQLVGTDFLMDMMDWRERIEDLAALTVASDRQRQEKRDALRVLWTETQLLQKQCETELERVTGGDGTNVDDNVDFTMDEAALQRARTLTAQLQYWHRLEMTLRETMEVWES